MEKRFAQYIGVKHAIALHSCTAALHLAMVASGVEGRQVLTTPMTFVASNHAILMAGGHPVFCDIEEDTLNIDPADVERRITPETRGLLAVHYGGHTCDMDALLDIAAHHDLLLIEDAAQACGGSHRGRKLGSLGHIGCFSFESKKNLSTGDGGMLQAERDASEKLIYQVLPSRYGFDPHHLVQAQAIEIVVGQGAKPGTGGLLMGVKVLDHIAEMRDLPTGIDQRSPARHPGCEPGVYSCSLPPPRSRVSPSRL